MHNKVKLDFSKTGFKQIKECLRLESLVLFLYLVFLSLKITKLHLIKVRKQINACNLLFEIVSLYVVNELWSIREPEGKSSFFV